MHVSHVLEGWFKCSLKESEGEVIVVFSRKCPQRLVW